jgi:hypothetical protein
MEDYRAPPRIEQAEIVPPPRRPSNAVWWILGGCGLLSVLLCTGVIGALAFVGTYGPETSVYTGNRVPSRFTRTMKSVGALDENEQILFFYSDALTDIRDGFYFVSDKRVVIYVQEAGDTPLTVVPFDAIENTELYRNESFFEDSQITLYLKDGQIVSFPVSSEYDRDEHFYKAILQRTGNASGGERPGAAKRDGP